MTYEYDAQEIKAPAFLNDPKVLAYLEGTDADIDRLVLEEDGKLWAYSKRTPGDMCRSSMEAMPSRPTSWRLWSLWLWPCLLLPPLCVRLPLRSPRRPRSPHST